VFVANLVVSYFKGKKAGNDLGRVDSRMVGKFAATVYNFASIPKSPAADRCGPEASEDRIAVMNRGMDR